MWKATIVLALVTSCLAYAKSNKVTITGYFWTFQDDHMPDGLKSPEERTAAIKRKAGNDETIGLIAQDDRNGYLALGFKTRQQSATHEFAIWRQPDNEPVVGINSVYKGAGGITGNVRFVRLRAPSKAITNSWRDDTAEIFGAFKRAAFQPKANAPAGCPNEPPLAEFPENFTCKLPRKGLTVVCQFNLNCETPTKLKPNDFYAKPIVKFEWKKDRFVAK